MAICPHDTAYSPDSFHIFFIANYLYILTPDVIVLHKFIFVTAGAVFMETSLWKLANLMRIASSDTRSKHEVI